MQNAALSGEAGRRQSKAAPSPHETWSGEVSGILFICGTQTLCFYLMASEELMIRTRWLEEGCCVWEEAGSAAGCCVGSTVH